MSENLIERLKALSERGSHSKLRNLMPMIDPHVRRGVSHEDIIATLAEGGLTVNIYTFRSALYAYRKKQRGGGVESSKKHTPNMESPNEPGSNLEPVKTPTYKQTLDKLGAKYVTKISR